MKVAHIAAECFPVLKAGGLGDVLGSLPKYLQKLNVDTHVIVPMHNSKWTLNAKLEVVYEAYHYFGNQKHHCKIWHNVDNQLGFNLYLTDIYGMFPRQEVYGYEDDADRFLFFQTVALFFIKELLKPDIVHCHDHHTGLIPFLMKYGYDFTEFQNTPSVYTIHNGEYTGAMNWDKKQLIPLYDTYKSGMIDWRNTINPMVAAIKNAWVVTTVSEGYLWELSQTENATGLAIRNEWMKSLGIINGIDEALWNPNVDSFIEKNYSIKDFAKGKRVNKETLCFRYGLNPDLPLIGFVGRMVHEKGADFIPLAIQSILYENPTISFMIVGSGNKTFEHAIERVKYKFPKNINTFIGYDEQLAHLIYAGSDFIMMPSRVEPCGLNQLYAMNYGTIPIVRKTGGLRDTVRDIDDQGEGFTFEQANAFDLKNAIKRAIHYPWNETQKNNHIKKLMEIDHSWEKSAKKYVEIYHQLYNSQSN